MYSSSFWSQGSISECQNSPKITPRPPKVVGSSAVFHFLARTLCPHSGPMPIEQLRLLSPHQATGVHNYTGPAARINQCLLPSLLRPDILVANPMPTPEGRVPLLGLPCPHDVAVDSDRDICPRVRTSGFSESAVRYRGAAPRYNSLPPLSNCACKVEAAVLITKHAL